MTRPSGTGVYQAVAHPVRRAILDALGTSEKPVNDLLRLFRMTQPALSQHLAVLVKAGLAEMRPKGRQHLYRANPVPLREVYDWISHYERFWQQKLARLGSYLENNS